jgi:NADPH2:quinone reductase
MKAVWYESFGKAGDVLRYGEKEAAEPGPGEVRVKLSFSAVNPSDVKKRNGATTGLLARGFVIPNSDGAGVIEATGEGVDAKRLGERVWVFNGQHGRHMGTSAGYITLPQEQAVFLPDEADFLTGACLGIPAMTAHRCVFSDGPVCSRIILVTGGAGRVGYYAIQLAKQSGAMVIASAGSDASRRQCEQAGADLVVDHPTENTARAVLDYTNGHKVDRVVEGDLGTNLPYLLDLMATGGVIASYASMGKPEPTLPFYRLMYKDLTLRTVLVYEMPVEAKRAASEDITNLLRSRILKHRIAETYPLSESVRAHEAIERGGQYGCVLLEI